MERPRPVLLGRDPSSRWCPRWDSNQILMILILLWLHLQFQKSGNHVETSRDSVLDTREIPYERDG